MITAEQARNNRLSAETILEEDMEYFYEVIRERSRLFDSCGFKKEQYGQYGSFGLRSSINDIVKKLKSLGYIVEQEQDYIIVRWHKL